MALAIPWNQVGKSKSSGKKSISSAALYNAYAAPQQAQQQSPYLDYFNQQNAANAAAGEANRRYATEDTQQANAAYGYGSKWLNTNYGTDAMLNQLDLQGTGIDRAAQQRLLAPGGLYGVQQTSLNQNRGILGAELANQMKGFGFDESTARRTNATDFRNMMSDAGARGAVVTEGTRNKTSDLAANLVDQLGQIDVGRKGAGIANLRGNISLNNEQAGLTENKAQAADATKKLDLQAKRLGINGTQLRNTLQQGLEKLNLDRQISVNDIARKLSSSNAQEAQQATQLYYQLLDYGGFLPKS